MRPAVSLLVIDDDPAFCGVLVRALARRGIAADSISDAAAAVAVAARLQPDRIVLDLQLGGDSGLALVQPLRDAVPGARIVVLTGYASIATAIDAIKRGAVHYLAKPVDLDSLLAAFAEAVPAPAAVPLSPDPLSVSRLEWEHIQRVLHEHGGNISATARALRMHRRTLQRKLGKHPAAN